MREILTAYGNMIGLIVTLTIVAAFAPLTWGSVLFLGTLYLLVDLLLSWIGQRFCSEDDD